MTISAFKATLGNPAPPEGLSAPLQAMWWDGKGNWDRAHDIAQDIENGTGSWIHAYLHRKEGDRSNAAYWYSRAGKSMPFSTLEEEWEQLVTALL
ncbi:hypothetical protein [uncultured Chitinophaga sp.]|jgi:hypothetical protein|uniref:hypothetical protein n=1 Tax=uncultured Chitinophaga sp. TaxID=339340 RepID=UPI002626E9CC|nr:hypothetical protein [uncultured Chitinophaga sp.]